MSKEEQFRERPKRMSRVTEGVRFSLGGSHGRRLPVGAASRVLGLTGCQCLFCTRTPRPHVGVRRAQRRAVTFIMHCQITMLLRQLECQHSEGLACGRDVLPYPSLIHCFPPQNVESQPSLFKAPCVPFCFVLLCLSCDFFTLFLLVC